MTSIRRLIVLGAAGTCVDILESARASGEFECLGFLDDAPALQGQSLGGAPVLGPLAMGREMEDVWFVNGIGSPTDLDAKRTITTRMGIPESRYATVVHPAATVSPTAVLGPGCVLLAGVSVGNHARTGAHVSVLQNSVIGHDSVIGDYCCLAASVTLSGNVRVGPDSYLGAACAFREGVTVGEGALVGMGSVVIRDVPPKAVMVGNPARRLRSMGPTRS